MNPPVGSLVPQDQRLREASPYRDVPGGGAVGGRRRDRIRKDMECNQHTQCIFSLSNGALIHVWIDQTWALRTVSLFCRSQTKHFSSLSSRYCCPWLPSFVCVGRRDPRSDHFSLGQTSFQTHVLGTDRLGGSWLTPSIGLQISWVPRSHIPGHLRTWQAAFRRWSDIPGRSNWDE